jgi:hypothetical protein
MTVYTENISLTNLKTAGSLSLNQLLNIVLPELEHVHYLVLPKAKNVKLPKIKTIQKQIHASNCEKLEAPLLEELNNPDIYSYIERNNVEINLPNLISLEIDEYVSIRAKKINFPKLKSIKSAHDIVEFIDVETLEMPSLTDCLTTSIFVAGSSLKKLKLDSLETIFTLSAPYAEVVILPKLVKVKYLKVKNAKKLIIPSLQEIYDLVSPKIEKIMVNDSLKKFLKTLLFKDSSLPSWNVEFIDSTALTEEAISFKNFFYLTNI